MIIISYNWQNKMQGIYQYYDSDTTLSHLVSKTILRGMLVLHILLREKQSLRLSNFSMKT